ncbi:MAG: hypothetical protein PHT88_04725 [Candidatus Moranbacteria bacterium]|nr:hypothetical protein [Candidatus Moranbacteria bacterium]
MTDDQALLKQAQLGIEAEAFIHTDLGKFLIDKADDDLQRGYEGFLSLTPGDTDGLLMLQSQCQRAIHFKSWLLEAISSGHYAESELSDD